MEQRSAEASPDRTTRVLTALPGVAAALAIAVGAIVLAGWAFDVAGLRTVLPGSVPMKAYTAVASILAGVALGLTRRSGGRAAGTAVVLIGGATLLEYVTAWNVQIDELLFRDPNSPFRGPGRMAATTAISFVLLGTALLLTSSSDARRRRSAEVLGGIVGLFALFEIEGYVLGTSGPAGYTRMTLHTALLLTVLSVGAIAAVPDSWLVAQATEPGPGGILMRRLMPVAIGLPLALGALGRLGEVAGWLDATASIWFMVILTMLLLIATGVSSVATVQRVERERRMAEVARRDTEDRFRAFFEESPVGMIITAPDGTLLRVNGAFCTLLGHSADELQVVSWTDLTHPDDLAQSQEALRALLVGEANKWDMEKRYRAKDGRWVWTLVSIGVHRGTDGDPLYFLTHVQDVNDRKAAAERLRTRERQLADAQSIAHVGSWEWDIANNRVTWSDELYRMYGLPPETAASYEAFQERVHRDDRDRVARIIARGLADRVTVDYEWRLVRPDGEVRQMLGRNITLVDGQGVAVGLAGTTLDVTERKRAEEALAHSEAYHRALIEQALDIITIIDGDAVMRYLSPSVSRVLGYVPTELVGKRAFDFIHPDDLEATLRTFTEGIETPGALRTLEYRFRHKDGSWRHLEGVGRNLLDDPLINAVVVNARDVSERKAAEEDQRTLLRELQTALAEVKTLRGFLRICASCKRVNTEDGKWEQFESYVRGHSDVEFSHGICPDCAKAWSASASEGPG